MELDEQPMFKKIRESEDLTMATADKHRKRSKRSHRKNRDNFNYFVQTNFKRLLGSLGIYKK